MRTELLDRRALMGTGAAAVGMLVTAGCGLVKPDPKPELSVGGTVEFTYFLLEERSREKAAPLADAVDFEWDDGSYFPYGTDAEVINGFAGKVVITRKSSNWEGHLFVFRQGGEGVAAWSTPVEILQFIDEGETFSSRVLVMHEKDEVVCFVEPEE